MSFLLTPARRMPSTISSISARTFSTTRPSQLARMTLVGRLGADPELADTGKGQIINFAPEGPIRDLTMGLSKGTLVYLEGDATMRTYDDADGKKQSSLSLVQTKVEVLKRPQPKEEEVLA